MLNEILENCKNNISWYKNWCKTWNKKTVSCILKLFTELTSQNLWLAFHAAWYCPLRMGRIGGVGGVVWCGVKGFLLKDKNLLSMTKVICRGSLSGWLLSLEFKIYLEKFISGDVEISCNTRLCVLVHRPAWLTEQSFFK